MKPTPAVFAALLAVAAATTWVSGRAWDRVRCARPAAHPVVASVVVPRPAGVGPAVARWIAGAAVSLAHR